ncbi:MAG TPA: sigma 54-interacting transcriptional regulator [Vicinamibacterales bacterium]
MTSPTNDRGIARSAAMVEAVAGLEQALVADGGVIIRGEAGTGGDVFARAIHLASSAGVCAVGDLLARALETPTPNGTPFVLFDCAVANAVERRLFGSDADRPWPEALEQVGDTSALSEALGGTLVLENLCDLPSRLQMRLARILRDGEVRVAATEKPQRVDLRPIALIDANDDERVNPDLRRQLSQTVITMPPLRERREDLPALIRLQLNDICGGLNLPAKRASKQAVALLSALPWPGNLPELDGLLRMLVLKVRERVIRQEDVLANIRLQGGPTTLMYGGSLKQARARFEREYVASVLAQHHGRMSEAAKTLGIQRTNLYRKVRQLSVARRRAGHR